MMNERPPQRPLVGTREQLESLLFDENSGYYTTRADLPNEATIWRVITDRIPDEGIVPQGLIQLVDTVYADVFTGEVAPPDEKVPGAFAFRVGAALSRETVLYDAIGLSEHAFGEDFGEAVRAGVVALRAKEQGI